MSGGKRLQCSIFHRKSKAKKRDNFQNNASIRFKDILVITLNKWKRGKIIIGGPLGMKGNWFIT